MAIRWGLPPSIQRDFYLDSLQPHEGRLPSGLAVPPVGEIALGLSVGALAAAVDPGDSKALEPAARESREVGHESAAGIRHERRECARVASEELLPDFR